MNAREIKKMQRDNEIMKAALRDARARIAHLHRRYEPDCLSCKNDTRTCDKCYGNTEHHNHYEPVGHEEEA